MKVETKSLHKDFEPIVLEITIESEAELKALWHRFNQSEVLSKTNTSREVEYFPLEDASGIFAKIDSHLLRIAGYKPVF